MSLARMEADLAKSKLTPADIGARLLENPERGATGLGYGIQGYVIPYFNIYSEPQGYYRVRTFDWEPKYLQPKNAGNKVYFPQGVRDLISQAKFVILTEGEKKAACAVKHGFPCVAFGGVDSWRNRQFLIPNDSEFKSLDYKGKVGIKLPAGEETIEDVTLASGMQELIDFLMAEQLPVIICYDRGKHGVPTEVQRAAASLGYELRFRGIPFQRIRQLQLPMANGSDKVGIDDYLNYCHPDDFARLIHDTLQKPSAFPRHPNPRDFINKRMQKAKLSRKEAQQVSMSVLCELDALGKRFRSKDTDDMYYFSNSTKSLMPASLQRKTTDVLVDSEFSRLLYTDYGIGNSDARLVNWLATQFTSEAPIDFVEPKKVVTVDRQGAVCYQINDGQYIRITSDEQNPYSIQDNGTNGVMFESDHVEPLNAKDLEDTCLKHLRNPTTSPFWPQVLNSVRLKRRTSHTADLIGILMYLSPWLNRWRGTQLPIEMAIGEGGSGKSSLYELRLNILTGRPDLRNTPHDMRDWWASIVSTGGMHVIDNVHIMDKKLKQSMSDEMCRLVTEPIPRIEQRGLYTNAKLIRLPVHTLFALTAIEQPFHSTDLLQRSILIELDKGTNEEVRYDARWMQHQLDRFGGRVEWVAHHVVTLHRFLCRCSLKWDQKYKAKHRLMHLEQCMVLMAEVLNIKSDWVQEHLMTHTITAASEADWALEGICCFARHIPKNQKFSVSDVTTWVSTQEDYRDCIILNSPRSLGRYMQANKGSLAIMAKIVEAGKKMNKQLYEVKP